MRLARRLDDALCAFRTGHSRRDLVRVNRRRLRLLCERAIESGQREIDADWTGLVGAVEQPALDAFRDDLQRFLQSSESIVLRRLAQRLDLRRSRLHDCRLDELARRKAGSNIVDAAFHYVDALSVPPAKSYGKLYKGLLEERPFDRFFGKKVFRGLDRHQILHRLKMLGTFCVRGKLPLTVFHGESGECRPRLWPSRKECGHA